MTDLQQVNDKAQYQYMQNRELSWLRFNQRVLEEAQDDSVPLMERLKFISIFTSNLDEFFMIRVGSLYDLSQVDNTSIDNKTGLSPSEQLVRIYKAVLPLYAQKDSVYRRVNKELSQYGIQSVNFSELDAQESKFLRKYYKDTVSELLSPQIVDSHHPFPHLQNKAIYVAAYLQGEKTRLLGFVPIPKALPEIVFLPGNGARYVHMEQLILENAEAIFDMYHVIDKTYFCITRNADITADDDIFDETQDFRSAMKKLLSKRRHLSIVRLELAHKVCSPLENVLLDKFGIKKNQLFLTKSPMKMGYVFSLQSRLSAAISKILYYQKFEPIPTGYLHESDNIFRLVKKHDQMLIYPYDSMDMFLALIKQASVDASVISIKITIYRLAQKARLVEYLCTAAENGKDVDVMIELRARFDEQNNIDWSERLEEAGCRLTYGIDEYKVHSKVCLITYKERNAIKYITQIATGNYNEKTAEQYSDLSLITADTQIGEDALVFFRNLSVGKLDYSYQWLLVAPYSLKPKILELIGSETRKGAQGRIIMKLNALTDKDIILALSQASCAGVSIDLIIRGICCILPGVEGYTDNIRVVSIVGRFLEHSRIYSFGKGELQHVYISSADLMTRNTTRRVEVACPIFDPKIKEQINHHLYVMLTDNVKARIMDSNGLYQRKPMSDYLIDAQEYQIKEAISNANTAENSRGNRLVRKKMKKILHDMFMKMSNYFE